MLSDERFIPSYNIKNNEKLSPLDILVLKITDKNIVKIIKKHCNKFLTLIDFEKINEKKLKKKTF